MITILEETITMKMSYQESRAIYRALGRMCRAAWCTAEVSEADINVLDDIYETMRRHFDPPEE